ncbi:unnamed protein product [Notodromas monacha]|uniref:Uncharacterized protein n=1 Tax=Notodromas monacha TaxID=399045 RepID=A0A7R9BRA9_9CRUS|nr:unnamed protein product [Notodromas monacha]CAG0919331.1 unnamed protein product [Notodromas monacha]
MDLRSNDVLSGIQAQPENDSASISQTTSSGREVILSWKIRSHQPKSGTPSDTIEKNIAAGKEASIAPSTNDAEDPNVKLITSASTVPGKNKKRRRTWETWTAAAKDLFFDALNEHGKDFTAIQNFFAMKVKKKALPASMMKNKEQVRHFFYRTWTKISKLLCLSLDDVKRGTLELYALINYGELRRKIGSYCDDEKSVAKLSELVQSGSTKVRIRGKTIRIRTPMCRALKKINDMDGKHDLGSSVRRVIVLTLLISDLEIVGRNQKLPELVQIQLRPRTGEAFARVQSLAHNPRVTANVSIQRRLSSLLRVLQRKWRPLNVKKRLELLNVDMELTPFTEELKKEPKSCIRLFPHREANLCVVKVEEMEQPAKVQSSCLSLNSHRERWKAAQAQKFPDEEKRVSKKTPAIAIPTVVAEPVREEFNPEVGTDDDEYDGDADDDGDTTQSEGLCSNSDGEHSQSEDVKSDSFFGVSSEITSKTEICLSVGSSAANDSVIKKFSNPNVPYEDESHVPDTSNDVNMNSFLSFIKLGTKAESNITEFIARHKAELPSNELKEVTPKAELTEEELAECERVNRFKVDGWDLDAAKLMTIGELYLLFGKPKKVLMEYEFVNSTIESTGNCDIRDLPSSHPRRLLKRLIDFAAFSLRKSKEMKESQKSSGTVVPLPHSPTPPAASLTKKKPKLAVETEKQPQLPPDPPSAIVSTSRISQDEFLFRVPLPNPLRNQSVPDKRPEVILKPQFKKLKKAEMIVRRIVPVENPLNPAPRRPPARKPKKISFHQAVLNSDSNVVWKASDDTPPAAAQRMNEALSVIFPKMPALEASSSNTASKVKEKGNGAIEMSFPIDYGMRKVVLDGLQRTSDIPAAAEESSYGNRTPASPSAISLLMDISFPDSEVALASQIMASPRSMSPVASSSSCTNFSSFTGLIRSLSDSFENPIGSEVDGNLTLTRTCENVCDSGTSAVEILPTSSGPSGLDEAAILAEFCPPHVSPLSPSQVLHQSDNQWLASEVMDESLGSLLGHLDNFLKPASGGASDGL